MNQGMWSNVRGSPSALASSTNLSVVR